MTDDVHAIIVAAGKGERAKQSINKVYMDLLGQSVLARSIEAFAVLQEVSIVTVVIAKADRTLFRQKIECNPDIAIYQNKLRVVYGGQTRQRSVQNGLESMKDAMRWTAVHDAARPLVEKDLIRAVFRKAAKTGAACPGIMPSDTIKTIDRQNGIILNTLERESLVGIQTPQVFETELLKKAYEKAAKHGLVGADDATLVENMGAIVHVVEGSPLNMKITNPLDFSLAEVILRTRACDG